MSLTDFLSESVREDKRFFVPEYLYKGKSVIKVVGFVYSQLARDYWNVSFYGIMQARDRFPEEYVLGHLEINKATGCFTEDNIRYTRFRDKRFVGFFKNILEKSL